MTAAEEVNAALAAPTPATFNDFSRHPPIEKFMTIDGMLRSHAAEPDEKPLICYPHQGVSDFEEYTAAAIDRYTDAAVQFYTNNGLAPVVSLATITIQLQLNSLPGRKVRQCSCSGHPIPIEL